MIVLFPLAIFGLSAAWLASACRARSTSAVPSGMTMALMALAVCYILGLTIVSLAPWYDDNGAPAFIAWRYRWAWAAELAGWLAIPVLPTVLGLRSLVRSRGGGRPRDRIWSPRRDVARAVEGNPTASATCRSESGLQDQQRST